MIGVIMGDDDRFKAQAELVENVQRLFRRVLVVAGIHQPRRIAGSKNTHALGQSMKNVFLPT